jgi:predicted lipoprotein with Yx(FWY)xxD motif
MAAGRASRVAVIRSCVVLAIGAVLALAATASASTTQNLALVTYHGNSFYNYDFDSQSAKATNVDWPVDLIFYGNASISKVYNKINWVWAGSNAYELVTTKSRSTWVSSGGRKNTICTDTHFRLYAPKVGYFTDPVLGHYVIGTSHLDKNECGSSPTYGWNETAEANVATRATAVWGKAAVKNDATTFPDGTSTLSLLDNFNETGWQGNHYFWNDGLPTLIKVS